MANILDKLFNYKKIRINGVGFVLRKLTPELFLQSDYWFPLSNWQEQVERGIDEKAYKKIIQEHKDKIKDVIRLGVVKVQHLNKDSKIDDILEAIMHDPEVYNQLFIEIFNYTLNLKKKLI